MGSIVKTFQSFALVDTIENQQVYILSERTLKELELNGNGVSKDVVKPILEHFKRTPHPHLERFYCCPENLLASFEKG